MKYTLAQAKKRLEGYVNVCGATSIEDVINDAIQALASLSGWECLRKVIRYSSAGPCFTLPQGSAGLVRVCVNGRPSTLRGQDFRFIQSGPGDLRVPPNGFRLIEQRNVLDLGEFPTFIPLSGSFRLFAYSDKSEEPYLTVKGTDMSGKLVSVRIQMTESPVYDDSTGELVSGVEVGSAEPDPQVFSSIMSVVVGDTARGYVTLYAEDCVSGERFPVSVYHPDVKVPVFRRYSLEGIGPCQPVDILAEVRIDPLALVDPSDVLPFDCIEPIEWMILYNWSMKSGEPDKAAKYQQQAVAWLKSKEVVNNTVQTAVVVNNSMVGSLGGDSVDSWNI